MSFFFFFVLFFIFPPPNSLFQVPFCKHGFVGKDWLIMRLDFCFLVLQANAVFHSGSRGRCKCFWLVYFFQIVMHKQPQRNEGRSTKLMRWDEDWGCFSLFLNLFYINIVPAISDIWHIFLNSFYIPSLSGGHILAFKIVLVNTKLMTWSTSHSLSVAVEFFLASA